MELDTFWITSWVEQTQLQRPLYYGQIAGDARGSPEERSHTRLHPSSPLFTQLSDGRRAHNVIPSFIYTSIDENSVSRSNDQQPFTPPSSETPYRPKRKRCSSMPATERSSSPQKRRRLFSDDDVLPDQSASQVGTTNVVILDSSTVLSAPSQGSGTTNPKRSSSPTRDHALELRTATPAITIDSLTGARPTQPVRDLRNALTSGFGRRFIPANLKACLPRCSEQLSGTDLGIQDVILHDPDLADEIEDEAFDETDERPLSALLTLLDDVRKIFIGARDCEQNRRDENAWCLDVVQPLLRLALHLHGTNEWFLQSVYVLISLPNISTDLLFSFRW